MLDLSTMNPPQREAVLCTDGPLLVLAGAGSGKTRVIVHRIAHLLEKGAKPTQILAVTFTNKAAAEMRERVCKLVPRKTAELLTMGTFHAFGLQLLRDHHKRVGLPPRFAIADGKDQEALIRRCMKEVKADERAFDLRRVLALVSRARADAIPPGEPVRRDPAPTLFGEEYDELATEVYPRYLKALRAMALVDFDDLIDLPIALLESDEKVRAKVQDRFRWLLVDEFQDTNRAQLQLLKLIGLPRGNVCAVGDDDQSIYGWRGAVVENILRYGDHFPGGTEVRLEQNYRSTSRILACANDVIAKNEARKSKKLFTTAGAGQKVQVVVAPREEDESRFVIEELKRSIKQGRRPGDHAILYRTNLQSRPFEELLRLEGIPYDLVGGQEFFDRREVKDLIAYLRAMLNDRDEVSLSRIVNFPPRGIGETTLERLRGFAEAHHVTLSAAIRAGAEGRLEEVHAQAPKLQSFVALMDELGGKLRKGTAAEVSRELLERTGYRAAVAAEYSSPEAAGKRLARIDEFLHSLSRYEQREGKGASLSTYLAQLALDRRDEEPGEAGDEVRLSSLHASKGLEFPVVFLVGWEEDVFPHKGMQGAPQDLPEERRLAYVGITRARERLYITRCAARVQRNREVERTPSRFLEDLPEEAIERVDVAASTQESEKRAETFFAELHGRLGGPGAPLALPAPKLALPPPKERKAAEAPLKQPLVASPAELLAALKTAAPPKAPPPAPAPAAAKAPLPPQLAGFLSSMRPTPRPPPAESPADPPPDPSIP